MSVVNRMLRDLDRRQGGEGEAVYTQHLRPVDGAARGRKVLLGVLLILVFALAGALFYVMQKPATNPTPAQVQAIAPPAATPPTRIEDSTAPVEAEPIVAPPAPEPAPAVAAAEIVPPLKMPEPVAPPRVEKPAAQMETTQRDTAPTESPAPPSVASAAPVEPTPAATQTHSGPTRIDVRPRSLPSSTAEGEFNRAIALINQGRAEEARAALASALKIEPRHEGARQTLAVLQVEAGLMNEAQTTLEEGLKLNASQANFAMLLARLKVETGDAEAALKILRAHEQQGTPNAELRAFAGTLLQRMGRHAEAAEAYRAALQGSPNVGIWWVGLGMSYEATERGSEAIDAYNRARASGNLPPEVREYVERKLQILR